VSLRAQIEAKQRRTANVPILVGNPSAAAAEINTFRAGLAAHLATLESKKKAGKRPTKSDRENEERLQAELRAAVERQGAMTVEVEIQSLPDDEWEAALAQLGDEDREQYDLSSILAVLLAASCTDPELQDAEWWTDQLKRPEWTDGDKAAISRAFLQLNVYAPRFDALGKD
jgi:hypothetical protein